MISVKSGAHPLKTSSCSQCIVLPVVQIEQFLVELPVVLEQQRADASVTLLLSILSNAFQYSVKILSKETWNRKY